MKAGINLENISGVINYLIQSPQISNHLCAMPSRESCHNHHKHKMFRPVQIKKPGKRQFHPAEKEQITDTSRGSGGGFIPAGKHKVGLS